MPRRCRGWMAEVERTAGIGNEIRPDRKPADPGSGRKHPHIEQGAASPPGLSALGPLKIGASKEVSSSDLSLDLDLLVPGLLGPVGRIIEGEVGGAESSASDDRIATQAFCAELDVVGLDRLLDRCRYSKDPGPEDTGEDESGPSFESRIFRAFGWPVPPAGHDWPVAAVTATLDRPNPSMRLMKGGERIEREAAASSTSRVEETGRAWLRADPVHLLAGIGDLVLSDSCSMDAASPDALDRAEADALVQVVNDALEPQGPFIVAPHPLRWYVALEATPRIKTAPPSTAIGKAVSGRLPRGADATFWHGWSNLVQMALHECPTNIVRTERKKLPINSLWLWGGGCLPAAAEIPPKEFECVWSDDLLVRALARLPKAGANEPDASGISPRPARAEGSGVGCRSAPSGAADWLARTKSGGPPSGRHLPGRHLIVHESLFVCAKRSDPQQWRERIEDFSARWANPLLEGLRSGVLARLSILDEYGHRFTASASSASWRRWWPAQKRGLAGAMVDALVTNRDRIRAPVGKGITEMDDGTRSDR